MYADYGRLSKFHGYTTDMYSSINYLQSRNRKVYIKCFSYDSLYDDISKFTSTHILE